MRVLDGLRDWLNSKSGVQMVADDPKMAAEVLLLLRVMFADGSMNEKELELFKQMCTSLFGIEADDVPEVVKFLTDTSYETNSEQAANVFRDMPVKRKNELLSNLLRMAFVDESFHDNEKDMIARIARTLGYSEEKIRSLI